MKGTRTHKKKNQNRNENEGNLKNHKLSQTGKVQTGGEGNGKKKGCMYVHMYVGMHVCM